ncbi:uncharacterized protein B0H64DRAFT_390294, partial [Chaetomium fimeti]
MEVNNESFPSISVSPLKRSDAAMSLDQTSFGSPVAKRRSLHGISTTETDEPSVFDQTPVPPPQNFDIHEDGNHEYELTGTYQSPFRDSVASPMPKRTSSLRRSTLQQRHGNTQPSLGRRAGEKQLAQLATDPGTPVARSRPRLSLDQYVPPEERPNPFSTMPSATPHPVQRTTNHPHPLSRLLSQSSSTSSHPDEEFPTQRPLLPTWTSTPHYKGAKPLQSAFMSTGLVSKMNRNGDGPLEHPRTKVSTMPDTPCKKQPYYSATFPPQGGSGGRRSRISFGSPSTPFSAVAAPVRGNLFGTPDKSSSLLFQQVRSGHTRKGSMLSVDDDELPEAQDELPPTPTKNLFFKSLTAPTEGGQSPGDRRSFAARAPIFSLGRDPRDTNASSKSDAAMSSMDALQNDDSPSVDAPPRPSTPFSSGSPCLGFSFASVAGSRSHPVTFATPAPARSSPALFASLNSAAEQVAKADGPSAASPLNMETVSPRTPQDAAGYSMTPPDPSSLSISNSQDGNARVSWTPATPSNSQGRQLFSSFAGRRPSTTPRNCLSPSDVDESLVSRFSKSEVIGKGEFSQVYRVVQSAAPSSFMMTLSSTPRTPSSPSSDRVYAVKKLRVPFQGVHDRESKLREVAVLQSLRHSSKVVQLIDSWDHNGHLYIQTEFCSEGSLDGFLKVVGQAGRLDDFRIWKILLETAQ